MLTETYLFTSAFLSATILPGNSEAALLVALNLSSKPPLWLITVATLGNTAGAGVTWAMARFLPDRLFKNASAARQAKIATWSDHYQRYGKWSLLFTWVPVVGDLIAIVAGLAKTPLQVFLPLVAIGKALRYAAIAGLFHVFQ